MCICMMHIDDERLVTEKQVPFEIIKLIMADPSKDLQKKNKPFSLLYARKAKHIENALLRYVR